MDWENNLWYINLSIYASVEITTVTFISLGDSHITEQKESMAKNTCNTAPFKHGIR